MTKEGTDRCNCASPGISPPSDDAQVDLSGLGSPRFVVTVDTEEEFDWNAPFSRDKHGMAHISAIPRFQTMCNARGVVPSYLVDYPVTQNARAAEMLGGYTADGRAEIGVQLHPWVNPPFDEDVGVFNSFACNLPDELEREKFKILYEAIVDKMATRPDSYRAGRYGAGPNIEKILVEFGVAIDTSARARFDYSYQGGPDYTNHPVVPYWLERGKLLELPVTTVFGGMLRGQGDFVFSALESETSRSTMARTGLLERIALTPEGIPVGKAIEAIDLALEQRVPVLNFSFHSPSLAAGHTPYVRSEADVESFYIWWEQVFDHLEKKGVRNVTMAEIRHVTVGEQGSTH